MSEDLEFPPVIDVLLALVNGKTFAGHQVTAGEQLQVDGYGAPELIPFVRLTYLGGNTGYIDQHDQVLVEVFAPAPEALDIAKAIRADLCGTDVATTHGTADTITAPAVPTAAFYNDRLDLAAFSLTAVFRPIN